MATSKPIEKAKKPLPRFITSSPADAEIIQKKTGANPTVEGNRLLDTRKYVFNIAKFRGEEILTGMTEEERKKILS